MKTTAYAALILAAVVAVRAADAQEPHAAPPKGTASIAGRVTAADTGKPIPGASVDTFSPDSDRLGRTARTNTAGRFEFTGLVPGRYELQVEAAGYVAYMFESSSPIDLDDGQRFDAAEIVMYRTGAVEGRLLDEFGDPAPNVRVQVSRLNFSAGRKRLTPLDSRVTDDRGHFRLYGLQPGRYYVAALSGAFANDVAGRTGGSPENVGPAGFAQTYYPSTADITDARPVEVKRGETLEANFSLVAAPSGDVQGTVVAEGQPMVRWVVQLSARDSMEALSLRGAFTNPGPDGRFAFRNVSPGNYTIEAAGMPVSQAGVWSSFGLVPLTVSGAGVSGLVIRTSRSLAARGRLVFEDGPLPPVPYSQVSVRGRAADFDSVPTFAGRHQQKIKADGTFEVLSLSSGRWLIRPDVTSPDWTLKQVTLDGQDVTDTGIEFTDKDVEGLEVVLTTRHPSVAGAVLDDRGRPTGNFSVVVFAVDPDRWAYPSRFIAHGRPNQQGRYKIAGLPPEDYLVVALPPVTFRQWEDPEFLESLRAVAQPVTLVEGDAKSMDLRIKR